jgi:anti-anti-sigma regulatory factor
VTQTIAETRPGQHLCQLCDGEDELRAATSDFVRVGLAAGDLVVHVTGSDVATVSAYLTEAGIRAEAALSSGQLRIIALGDVEPGPDGSLLAGLAQALGPVLEGREAAGYAAIRLSSELDPLVGEETLADLLAREQGAAELTSTQPVTLLCLYGRRLVADHRDVVAEQHDAVVVREDAGEVLYADAMLTITRPVGGGLRIVGEIDISNGSHLRDALADEIGGPGLADLAAPGEVRVDLSGLEFIDVVGLRHLAVAAELHPHRRLVLVAPSTDLRRLLDLSGWVLEPNLVVETRGGRP